MNVPLSFCLLIRIAYFLFDSTHLMSQGYILYNIDLSSIFWFYPLSFICLEE